MYVMYVVQINTLERIFVQFTYDIILLLYGLLNALIGHDFTIKEIINSLYYLMYFIIL